jgi:GNAT superfamily N-acetyltransferase
MGAVWGLFACGEAAYTAPDNYFKIMLDDVLENYPRPITLHSGLACEFRPLENTDEKAFHEFFRAVPAAERLFIKHRVDEPGVIADWCRNIDLGRILPLLAVAGGQIIADASLHQQLGGWKRHIGRVSVLVHPEFRGRGLARALVEELMEIGRDIGLEKMEAEFIGEQERAIKVFSQLGFRTLLRLDDYVKDMQALNHDYVLMGVDLTTDEEYAGAE